MRCGPLWCPRAPSERRDAARKNSLTHRPSGAPRNRRKTCLLLRYAYDSFSSTFITTIGIDFKIKYVDVGDKRVKLQVWDTAGQER